MVKCNLPVKTKEERKMTFKTLLHIQGSGKFRRSRCDVIVPGNFIDVTTPEITQHSASTINPKQTRVTGLAEMLVSHETFSVLDLAHKNSRSSGANKPPHH